MSWFLTVIPLVNQICFLKKTRFSFCNEYRITSSAHKCYSLRAENMIETFKIGKNWCAWESCDLPNCAEQ